MNARSDLLPRIEVYYDLVPRALADAEDLGSFTLFVASGPSPLYARPRAGHDMTAATTAELHAVRTRQRHGAED